jgi:hypothetical protein
MQRIREMALYVVSARIHCTVRGICGFTLWVQPYGFTLWVQPYDFTLRVQTYGFNLMGSP